MGVDTQTLCRSVDLADLAAKAGANLRREGNWHKGPCPFCGGVDRFVVHDTENGGRWLCRGCTDGKYLDAIALVQRWQNMTFTQACAWLGGDAITLMPRPAPAAREIRRDTPPPEDWQQQARAVIEATTRNLWGAEGKRARVWLNARGLTNDTLRRFSVGCLPYAPDAWTDKEGVERRKIGGKWVPCGIVLPCIERGIVWAVKVRRARGEPKYIHVKRPDDHKPAALYGASTFANHNTAVLVEGEFDAMLLWQQLGELVGVGTVGSAQSTLTVADWAAELLPIRHLYLAMDGDAAGERAAENIGALTRRAHKLFIPAWPIPGKEKPTKDVSELHGIGIDLVQWLLPQITPPHHDTEAAEWHRWAAHLEGRGYDLAYADSGNLIATRVQACATN